MSTEKTNDIKSKKRSKTLFGLAKSIFGNKKGKENLPKHNSASSKLDASEELKSLLRDRIIAKEGDFTPDGKKGAGVSTGYKGKRGGYFYT